MRISLAAFATDYSISATALAVAAEERGVRLRPVRRAHPHPVLSRDAVPHPPVSCHGTTRHTLDPFVALRAAAAVTQRLLIGTGICLITEHDPIALAKTVASVDHLADGRSLGAGWNVEEMRNQGADPARRWAVTRDRIHAMQAIWSADEAAYHGEMIDFDPIWSWPKPVRKPWPPILLGQAGSRALDHVLEYADEWMPIYSRVRQTIGEDVAELRRRALDRDRKAPGVTVYWASDVPELDELAAAGVDRVLFEVPVEDEAETVRTLDSWRALGEVPSMTSSLTARRPKVRNCYRIAISSSE